MQQIALVDRLDQQRVVLGPPGGALAGRRQRAVAAIVRGGRDRLRGETTRARWQPLKVIGHTAMFAANSQGIAPGDSQTSANAAAAASTVRDVLAVVGQ